MEKLKFFGILIIALSIVLNFQSSLTGFLIIESVQVTTTIFIITFLFGIFMVAISGNDLSGGLEKVLDNDVVGVITFVRHGEKNKEGKLTKKGINQAKKLGINFKEIYNSKNEGNLYLATSSSPVERVYDTVKEIVGVETKYNKPIIKDKRLTFDEGDWINEYANLSKDKGQLFADNWYINSRHGEEVAEGFANFLESNKNKFEELNKKGKKFHYIAGTHQGLPEAFLKRVLVQNSNGKKKIGFESVEEIGGVLDFAEPINFILKENGDYQINFRNKVYDVDMKKLHNLAREYNG